jgi:uncharacterized membrane protein
LSIWADKRRRAALLLAAAVVLSAALIGASRISSGETGTRAAAVSGSSLAGIPQAGAALGNPNAPVTFVEYADLQCPYCAEWARRTLPVLVDDYVRTGKLRIVFRGLAFIGPDSERALRAAIAAFSLYLFYVQVELIGAICDWCLASDAIVSVLAMLALLRYRIAQDSLRVSG